MTIKSTASLTSNLKQDTDEVVCDGGAGALGHPKIYLPFGNKSEVICYYCGKRFEKK